MNKIIFQKPDYKKLREEYNLFDMHIHSKYSDGIGSIGRILKKANKLGVGISITDHNGIKGAEKAYKNRFDVKVIPGIEIMTTKYEELLFYFYKLSDLRGFYKIIKKRQTSKRLGKLDVSLSELINYGRRLNAVISIPHPYWPIPTNYKRILKNNERGIFREVDAVEVLNSQKRRNCNLKAIELCKKFQRSITGGSDTHILSELGRCVTCAKGDVLEDIIRRRVMVVGKEIRFTKKIRSHSCSATKNILRL